MTEIDTRAARRRHKTGRPCRWHRTTLSMSASSASGCVARSYVLAAGHTENMTTPQPAITVDPELLGDREDDVSVYVETARPELAVSALEAANPRLALVTSMGGSGRTTTRWTRP
jgi:hypothetical protein